MSFHFEILHRDPSGRARLGRLTTPHGAIDTPNFIFCGTKASIKGVDPAQVRAAGADIILSNTYHLMLSPGADLIAEMGGLHKFTGWNGPMFTDSGGFQIFSLGHGSVADEIKGKGNRYREKTILKITEEGAAFRSYLDGAKHFLTPESSIQIQHKLGADLIVQLDECTPYHVDKDYTARSMAMSMRWGDRSIAEHKRIDTQGRQAMYGIVQGGVYPDLRRESAEYTRDRDFFATAVGGSLGATKEQMYEVVGMCMEHIHQERPVHLLGIGDFDDVFANVRQGIDTFDCVSPTRVARHGWALRKGEPKGRMNLRNARFARDTGPVDCTCECHTCKSHSRGYIHHLFRTGEILGMQLLSVHNIATMARLMREIRAALRDGTFDALEKQWVAD